MGKAIDEAKARQDLLEIGRLAYQRGYICGKEGNFSIRLDGNRILTTPADTCKARLNPDDLVITDLEGQACAEDAADGKRPSTELKMHLTVYEERPDARAVVHAHPTTAVGFTVAGLSLEQCVLPEVVCTLGNIPTAPYATPSTDEIPESIRKLVRDHEAVLLDHHGAITMGSDIWDAYYKLETLEHFAQTLLIANMLGGVKPLKSSQVEKLLAICASSYGLKRPANEKMLLSPTCSDPG